MRPWSRRGGAAGGRRGGASPKAVPPGAPTISGAPTIGGTMTIVDGAGATTSRSLYRDGVLVGVITSGYTYVAADIGPSLTVVPTGPGGVGPASNALVWAGISSVLGSTLTLLDNELGQTGSPITPWSNQKGGGYADWTASGAGRPTTGGVINGLAAPTFDGVANKMASTGALSTLVSAGAGWLMLVLNTHAVAGASISYYQNECVLADSGGYFWIGFQKNGATYTVGFGIFTSATKQVTDTITLDADTLIEAWFDGVNVNLRVGNRSVVSLAATSIGSMAGTGKLGSNYNATQFFNGKVGTIVAANAVPSAGNRADLRAFHTYKYGVAS